MRVRACRSWLLSSSLKAHYGWSHRVFAIFVNSHAMIATIGWGHQYFRCHLFIRSHDEYVARRQDDKAIDECRSCAINRALNNWIVDCMQGHAAYCLLTRISCAYCAVYTYVVTFKDDKLVRLSKYIRFLFYFSDKMNENNQSALNNGILTRVSWIYGLFLFESCSADI